MNDLSKRFVSTYNGISRVLVNEVYISKAFSPTKQVYKLGDADCKKYNAIWDTGATGTVITNKVARECGLIPISVTRVISPGGTKISYVYLVNIWLPNRLMVPNLRVVEGEISGGEEILVGMDIINRGDFAVSNKDGKTVFTYRFPSMEKIDFVNNPYKEKPVRKSAQVGRNSPCPCGSGKKYKRCCGKDK